MLESLGSSDLEPADAMKDRFTTRDLATAEIRAAWPSDAVAEE
jgi:hypothetical protein